MSYTGTSRRLNFLVCQQQIRPNRSVVRSRSWRIQNTEDNQRCSVFFHTVLCIIKCSVSIILFVHVPKETQLSPYFWPCRHALVVWILWNNSTVSMVWPGHEYLKKWKRYSWARSSQLYCLSVNQVCLQCSPRFPEDRPKQWRTSALPQFCTTHNGTIIGYWWWEFYFTSRRVLHMLRSKLHTASAKVVTAIASAYVSTRTPASAPSLAILPSIKSWNPQTRLWDSVRCAQNSTYNASYIPAATRYCVPLPQSKTHI